MHTHTHDMSTCSGWHNEMLFNYFLLIYAKFYWYIFNFVNIFCTASEKFFHSRFSYNRDWTWSSSVKYFENKNKNFDPMNRAIVGQIEIHSAILRWFLCKYDVVSVWIFSSDLLVSLDRPYVKTVRVSWVVSEWKIEFSSNLLLY